MWKLIIAALVMLSYAVVWAEGTEGQRRYEATMFTAMEARDTGETVDGARVFRADYGPGEGARRWDRLATRPPAGADAARHLTPWQSEATGSALAACSAQFRRRSGDEYELVLVGGGEMTLFLLTWTGTDGSVPPAGTD